MGNAFNNYFAKAAINIQSSILFFFKKKYCGYLLPTKALNIISSLNLDKSDGPNSIPPRILKLSNKDKSDQLGFLFNQTYPSDLNSLQF